MAVRKHRSPMSEWPTSNPDPLLTTALVKLKFGLSKWFRCGNFGSYYNQFNRARRTIFQPKREFHINFCNVPCRPMWRELGRNLTCNRSVHVLVFGPALGYRLLARMISHSLSSGRSSQHGFVPDVGSLLSVSLTEAQPSLWTQHYCCVC